MRQFLEGGQKCFFVASSMVSLAWCQNKTNDLRNHNQFVSRNETCAKLGVTGEKFCSFNEQIYKMKQTLNSRVKVESRSSARTLIFVLCYSIKQINSILPCVCSDKDQTRRQRVVRTSVSGSPEPGPHYILTSFVIYN